MSELVKVGGIWVGRGVPRDPIVRDGVEVTACDFCGKPAAPDDLTPEEGNLWACMECWDRWEAEDAAEWKRLNGKEMG